MTWRVTLVSDIEGESVAVAGVKLNCSGALQAAEEAANIWNLGPGDWGVMVSRVGTNPPEVFHYRIEGRSVTFYKAKRINF